MPGASWSWYVQEAGEPEVTEVMASTPEQAAVEWAEQVGREFDPWDPDGATYVDVTDGAGETYSFLLTGKLTWSAKLIPP
jgi:hypothetical protein